MTLKLHQRWPFTWWCRHWPPDWRYTLPFTWLLNYFVLYNEIIRIGLNCTSFSRRQKIWRRRRRIVCLRTTTRGLCTMPASLLLLIPFPRWDNLIVFTGLEGGGGGLSPEIGAGGGGWSLAPPKKTKGGLFSVAKRWSRASWSESVARRPFSTTNKASINGGTNLQSTVHVLLHTHDK